jgi:dihydrolipoamide dehydrogenase
MDFDFIAIGSGAGMNVAASALEKGLRVAVVEKDEIGGTCLNRGCIPSKVLIYPADVIRILEAAKSVGIFAEVKRIDLDLILKRMWNTVLEGRREMEIGLENNPNITLFSEKGYFSSDYTINVNNEIISAKKIVIACGSRPKIPLIEGLDKTDYLTSETIFSIRKKPDSLIIIGGGYIATEMSHFFSSIGTNVNMIGKNPRLVPKEEPEVSSLLFNEMSRNVKVFLNHEPIEAISKGNNKVVKIRERNLGNITEVEGEEILVAAGVQSNADTLKLENTGVEVTSDNWIKVDKYLETSKKNIWALGDVIGRNLYRHTANYESEIVTRNALYDKKVSLDEHAVPHAIFTNPQISGVGMTEEEAAKSHLILVGIGKYSDIAKGYAMAEKTGFVKVIVDAENQKILGAHIIGPEAAILIQHIVYIMNAGEGDYLPLARAQTIHPALSEVVINAFGNLRPANFQPYGHNHH